MTINALTTLRELAFIVSTALTRAGISAVLSGGGAATVYAPDANQSNDLDFVLSYWSSQGVSAAAILNLGFEHKEGNYLHPLTKFTLEFPIGPLSIGDEVITEWTVLKEDDLELQILSPTDCVRDRLSWFLFYSNTDYSALEQALAVAAKHEVDLNKIRVWCEAHQVMDRYALFESRLEAKNLEPGT